MTDRDALTRLIEAVEAGSWTVTNWRDFAAVPAGDPDNPGAILAHRAYHGSMDAAIMLMDALLPGWWWGRFANSGEMYVDHLSRVDLPICYAGDKPARALLLAILRAVEAGR